MQLQLPKWMTDSLNEESEKSIQYTIKEVLREYLNSEEGRIIRERIEKRKEH